MFTNVSEEHAASIHPEEGSSRFLQNAGNHLRKPHGSPISEEEVLIDLHFVRNNESFFAIVGPVIATGAVTIPSPITPILGTETFST